MHTYTKYILWILIFGAGVLTGIWISSAKKEDTTLTSQSSDSSNDTNDFSNKKDALASASNNGQSTKQNQTISPIAPLPDSSVINITPDLFDSTAQQPVQHEERLTLRKEMTESSGVLQLLSKNNIPLEYAGIVQKGQANGYGIGLYETGSIYKGNWKNNFRNGNGLFIWKDGERYEGNYDDDKRNGFGIYTWRNGEYYKGFWKNDKRDGEGKLFRKNGKLKMEGLWQDDVFITKQKTSIPD